LLDSLLQEITENGFSVETVEPHQQTRK